MWLNDFTYSYMLTSVFLYKCTVRNCEHEKFHPDYKKAHADSYSTWISHINKLEADGNCRNHYIFVKTGKISCKCMYWVLHYTGDGSYRRILRGQAE